MSDTPKPVKKTVAKRLAKKPRVALEDRDPVSLQPVLIEGVFYEPVWRTRFLFADGTVEDIISINDDSRLRELLLKRRTGVKNDRIVGSARVCCIGYAKLTDLFDPDLSGLDATG